MFHNVLFEQFLNKKKWTAEIIALLHCKDASVEIYWFSAKTEPLKWIGGSVSIENYWIPTENQFISTDSSWVLGHNVCLLDMFLLLLSKLLCVKSSRLVSNRRYFRDGDHYEGNATYLNTCKGLISLPWRSYRVLVKTKIYP